MSATRKAQARKQAFANRKLAFDPTKASTACTRLTTFLRSGFRFDTVAAYMPIQTEISPLDTMKSLHELGKSIAIPVIQAAHTPLKFGRWTPGIKLVKGPFGAAIPAVEEFIVPDVVITPLVAFDARGYRLGYGGGYYDRTFELLRKSGQTPAIGFAFSAQELDEVPTEKTDVRLDHIVTEKGVLSF